MSMTEALWWAPKAVCLRLWRLRLVECIFICASVKRMYKTWNTRWYRDYICDQVYISSVASYLWFSTCRSQKWTYSICANKSMLVFKGLLWRKQRRGYLPTHLTAKLKKTVKSSCQLKTHTSTHTVQHTQAISRRNFRHIQQHTGTQQCIQAFRQIDRLSGSQYHAGWAPEALAKLFSSFPGHSREPILGSGPRVKDGKAAHGRERN